MNASDILFPVLIFAGMGAILGVLLAVAAKIFEVKTDPRADEILEVLPGANCGGCGKAGCAALAAAIAAGEAPANACAVGGAEVARKIGASTTIPVPTTALPPRDSAVATRSAPTVASVLAPVPRHVPSAR